MLLTTLRSRLLAAVLVNTALPRAARAQACTEEEFLCPGGQIFPEYCIPADVVCDGEEDCADGRDEWRELCFPPTGAPVSSAPTTASPVTATPTTLSPTDLPTAVPSSAPTALPSSIPSKCTLDIVLTARAHTGGGGGGTLPTPCFAWASPNVRASWIHLPSYPCYSACYRLLSLPSVSPVAAGLVKTVQPSHFTPAPGPP